MTRLIRLTVAAFVLLSPAIAITQDKPDDPPAPSTAPPAGTWKLYLPFIGKENASGQPRYLVRFEKKAEQWQGKIVAKAENWPKATISKPVVADNVLRFDLKVETLSIPCELKLPKDAKATKLYGSGTIRKRTTPVELEATTLKSLDEFELDKERFDKEAPGHEAIRLGLNVLGVSEAQKIDPKLVRAAAEKVVRSAGLYGPGIQRDTLLNVARVLNQEKGYEKIALEYARRAERGLDTKDAPAVQKRVLEVLSESLERNNREEEVKTVQARLAKLDFRIKPKMFAGRKAKSDRVVLVELFTGAECPPCVAADLAFDSVAKSYKPSEVVLLQYHMHIPGPDPLTSPDSERRAQFYSLRGTPMSIFNGGKPDDNGGNRDDAPEKYEEYLEAINPLLETPAEASLNIKSSQKGTKITIDTEVAKVPEVGDDMRLRLALVEEEVNYKGRNGVPVHHQVVRSMPGGADGMVIKEKTFKKSVTVDIEEVKKQLKEYLEKADKRRAFPNKERPLELKKLRVIAFVQNDKTGEVLQAAQADVKVEE